MKKCPFCKAELEDNARFCLFCMTQLDEKTIVSAKSKKKTMLIIIGALAALLIVLFLSFYFSGDESEPQTESSSLNDISFTETAISSQEDSDNSENISDENPDASNEILYENTSDDSDENTNESEGESENESEESKPETSEESNDESNDESNEESNDESSSPSQQIVYKYRASTPNDEFAGLSLDNAITIIGVETVSENGVYTIPETIDGKRVFAIASNAFCEEHIKDTVKTVIIPKSVKNIANYAFYDCYNMTDLYLCGEAVAGSPFSFLPPKEKCNGVITLHASATCHDRNLRTYKSMYSYEEWAGNDVGWIFEEWNG